MKMTKERFIALYDEYGPHVLRVGIPVGGGISYFKVDESHYKVDDAYKVELSNGDSVLCKTSQTFYLSDLTNSINRGIMWLAKETTDGIEPLYIVLESL